MLTSVQRELKTALTAACASHSPASSLVVRHYVDRARRGGLLSPYDGPAIMLVRKLEPSTLLEIGACAGQFGLMLAAEGWNVTATDVSPESVELGRRLGDAAIIMDPSLVERHRYLRAPFPNGLKADVFSLLGCPIFGPAEEVEPFMERCFRTALNAASYLVIDLRYYPKLSNDPQEWSRRLELFPAYAPLDGFGYAAGSNAPSVFLLKRNGPAPSGYNLAAARILYQRTGWRRSLLRLIDRPSAAWRRYRQTTA